MTEWLIDRSFLAVAAWQSTLWLGAGITASRLLARRPARAHAVLVACSLAAVASPLITELVRHLGWGWFAASDVGPREPAGAAIPTGPIGLASGPTPGQWCVLSWSVVTLALVVRLGVGMARCQRSSRRSRRHPAARFDRLVEDVAAELALPRTPAVHHSPAPGSPAVWGWSSPARVHLPTELAGAPGLRGVVAHELAHILRRDHWSALAAELSACALPWHPLAWAARARARELAEQACDEWALALGAPPAELARSLLDTVPRHRPAPALALRTGRRRLAGRIERLFACADPRPRVGLAWRRGLGALALALAASIALAQPRAPEVTVDSRAPRADRADLAREIERLRTRGIDELVVLPRELDLGSVRAGELARGSLWLLNPTSRTQTLQAARANCGCTRVELPSPTGIPAGAFLELPVTMESPTSPGQTKTKRVTLKVAGERPLLVDVTCRTYPERRPR